MAGEQFKPQNAEKGEEYWKDKYGAWGRILGDDTYCIRPNYSLHFAIMDGLKKAGYDTDVQAFDTYQGPYIVVGPDIRAGSGMYHIAVQGMGIIRLWLIYEEGFCKIYREDNEKCSGFFKWDDEKKATNEAIDLVKGDKMK